MLVRLVAMCVMLVGFLDTALYLTRCFEPKHPEPVRVLPIVTNSIPVVVGAVILMRAKAIAEWLADWLE
ncbi:MAG TPA: hypothetical protein VMH30_14630 [Verrucomicrobiae bacterium]|nr:hypothetical protein [Verrucomicrobiae bacterium]